MQRSIARDRRLVKGTIIGLAGLGLLIGGGTFALWYDSTQISGADIASGDLGIALNGVGTWANQNGALGVPIADYLIVPGDTLTLTQSVDITAEGTELTALLSLDVGGLTGDAALMAALDTSMTIGTPPAGIVAAPGGYAVDGSVVDGTATVPIEVTIEFPETTDGAPLAADRSNYWHLDAQDESIQLDTIEFDLVQTV